MPCHWIKDDDGTPVMIPECYGGAHDPKECTCEVGGSQLDQALEALREAEDKIVRLIASAHERNHRYTQLSNMNRQLRDRIRELEANDQA